MKQTTHERAVIVIPEETDVCSGLELVFSGPLYCFHQLDGNPEWEAVYATKNQLRLLRDTLNTMEL